MQWWVRMKVSVAGCSGWVCMRVSVSALLWKQFRWPFVRCNVPRGCSLAGL